MDHGRFEELKDAYVLGALAEQERREFEEYLAAHPERQAEVDELEAVAGLLALAPQSTSHPRSFGSGSWAWWRPRRAVPVPNAHRGSPGFGSC